MRVRQGRAGAIAVLGLILGAAFFMGLVFWVILKPDFGIAYDITNPDNPFTFTKPGGGQAAPPDKEEPVLTLNQTLAALRERGCAVVEGEPDNLDPNRLVYLGQAEFMDAAEDRKLVFLSVGEEGSILYVPVKEGHVAWREPAEPG